VRAEAERVLALDSSNERPRFVLGAVALAHDCDWSPFALVYAISDATTRLRTHPRWPALAAAMRLPGVS
jgi:hypothetical protein